MTSVRVISRNSSRFLRYSSFVRAFSLISFRRLSTISGTFSLNLASALLNSLICKGSNSKNDMSRRSSSSSLSSDASKRACFPETKRRVGCLQRSCLSADNLYLFCPESRGQDQRPPFSLPKTRNPTASHSSKRRRDESACSLSN